VRLRPAPHPDRGPCRVQSDFWYVAPRPQLSQSGPSCTEPLEYWFHWKPQPAGP